MRSKTWFDFQVDKLQTDHRGKFHGCNVPHMYVRLALNVNESNRIIPSPPGTFVLRENSCLWLTHFGPIDTPRGKEDEEAGMQQ